ncbi:MAG TPA: FtsW/RodA/SpoVE family cell cycle protein [Nocardioides sp.]|uniref:FtsW/RodA/SpoVE family cell cycle protein n=1 Tax=Nocardioides sp. TaxID=35761 RepID=UPI002C91D725|nr:FtsW/RodA/SpoVE family cell cycle protein [Nocardioides sp.]HQR26804.1 FtsW/RodA/SpoVE family cell cycle protein [Nocardioides sp.]
MSARVNQPSALRGFVHRPRRGAELFLLVLALAVGIGAYAAVGIGVQGTVPADLLGYGGWLALLIIGAHVVVRFTAPYADPVLLPLVAALNGLGLAVIHRLDLAAGKDPGEGFSRQQLTWMTLGVLLFAATLVLLRDYRVLQRFTYTFGLAAIVLLLMPMLPVIGKDINGARIWIHVGPFSFQPGEIAKVLLVLAFAGYLVRHRDALALAGRRVLFVDLPRGRDLGPILVMWLVSLGILVFQRDLGSSLLFFGLFVVMLYVATERPGWLLVGGALFAAGGWIAYRLFSHVALRVDIWRHPFEYYGGEGVHDRGRQTVETMFGMAWGGLLGRGFGNGQPWRISYAESDFIVGAIGEELGLTAVMAVIVCYGLIVERGLRTALICRDDFGKLVATGLASVFALQVFVVVGGVTRLIPLTGLTTPFLSYGGSSLVANWVIVALLLRISDQARRPAPVLAPAGPASADEEETQVVRLG